MGRLLMAHSRIGPTFQALFSEIMFVPGALDRQEREMIAAVAAGADVLLLNHLSRTLRWRCG